MTDRDDHLRDRYREDPGYSAGPPTERIPRVVVPPSQPPSAPLPYPPLPAPTPPRPVKPKPTRGWRRAVHTATFGLVNPGPSRQEQRQAAMAAMVAAPLRGHYKIGVLGKGGVGKTTVAASVGCVLAELRRGDRVVAVDADTAFGRLGSRIDPRAGGSYWELAKNKNLQSFAEVLTRMGSNSSGLFVLAGENGSRRGILDPAIYREATMRLDRHFTISIVDCGSTMDAPVTQEAMRDMDALIVVSSPWPDGASAAAQTLEWLAAHGKLGLLQRSVIVLNDSDGHSDKRTRGVLADQFRSRRQAVVEVPFDPGLRPGGVINNTAAMSAATRDAFIEVAAVLSHFFATMPQRGPETR
ncbi:MinD/ParA family protein [Mycolicibacterium sp. CH28]|uniref:MinD/ParA family ATP-binding protein n=1 Tax=Mycolicibacterium sp. CH28 TaxID=2512237 RepID=UPI001080E36B|nr:MinD/ParA family protein [Mycolicibacterium sp. CH28]TGD89362.1 MinD/ParA family protein [Mycolicibacterium sp. CH28]